MEKQKKNDSGITLVALVVSIIVMLVLAGVSLNATIGENGIVTRAQEAAEMSKKSSIIEAIQTHLMRYNIDLLSGDKKTAAKTAIDNLIRDEVVDNCMTSTGTFTTDTTELAAIPLVLDDGSWTGEFEYVVGKDEYAFNIYQDKDGMFKAEISDIIAGAGATGGQVTGGKTLVTSDTFTSGDSETTDENEKGMYTIIGDANVIFADKINGSFSIHVSGTNVTATVSIFDDMTLSNTGLKRSAIDIDPTCTLNLWIAEGAEVTVDSGLGEIGEQGTVLGTRSVGGKGGYAGVHVASTDDGIAKINLGGAGIIKCFGGNAGNGGSGVIDNTGGAGGGGAGAGIGGNGGNGGNGGGHAATGSEATIRTGLEGEKGEDCGIVNISNELTVYAYGGSGGYTINGHTNAGNGGSGYPAAGIGGGGAGGGGGTSCNGGGGYCGGGAESLSRRSDNGKEGVGSGFQGGGGYFGKGRSDSTGAHGENPDPVITTSGTITTTTQTVFAGELGGGGSGYSSKITKYDSSTDKTTISYSGETNEIGGNGGIAGAGGIITVSKLAKVYAYNGNMYTDGTSYNNGQNQLLIVAQSGLLRKVTIATIWFGQKSSFDYDYFHKYLGSTMLDEVKQSPIPYIATLRNEINDTNLKTNYINSLNSSFYGVGSGAGYIEYSNGSYTIDPNLN